MKRGFLYFIRCAHIIGRIFFVFGIVLFVPQLSMYYAQKKQVDRLAVTFGIQNYIDHLSSIRLRITQKKQRINLLTDQCALATAPESFIDQILEKGIDIRSIYRYDTFDGLCSSMLPKDKRHTQKLIAMHDEQQLKALFKGVDRVLVDVQGTGFAIDDGALLLSLLTHAHTTGIPLVICDRPNILGPRIEGFSMYFSCGTKHGIHVPYRYGLTMGELAHVYNHHLFDDQAPLEIIFMKHYQRKKCLYMPLFAHQRACAVHCAMHGLCNLLTHAHPLHVRTNVGDNHIAVVVPDRMQVEKKWWHELQSLLHSVGIESKMYTYSHQKDDTSYVGLLLSVKNISLFSLHEAFMHIITCMQHAGISCSYDGVLHDMIGVQGLPSYHAGAISREDITALLQHESERFYQNVQSSLSYQPLVDVQDKTRIQKRVKLPR